MSEGFDNNLTSQTYFQGALAFLDQFQWVFDFPVTHLLVLKVLKELPERWKDTLNSLSIDDMNTLPLGDIKEEWSDVLTEFCQRCNNYRFPVSQSTENVLISDESTTVDELKKSKNMKILKNHGVGAKKILEVSKLTSCIHNECQKVGVSHIMDMGSGLGYLDHALHALYGYRILGLESQLTFVQTASKKQEKFCPSTSEVVFRQFHMASGLSGVHQAAAEAQDWLAGARGSVQCSHGKAKAPGSQVAALVGLHTCGDLAASTLRLFTSSRLFSVLVLAPCCFHKMTYKQVSGETAETFDNFPMSRELKTAVASFGGVKFLRRPFLRLACQRSALRWSRQSVKEHQQHSEHVLARAVLQLYASSHGLEVTKTRRRALAKANLGQSGADLVKHMMSRYQLQGGEVEETAEARERHLEEVTKLFSEHSSLCHLIEGITALQTALQGVAERLVLADMQALLSEHGAPCSRVVPLWDEARSPRSRVILATRRP